MRQWAVLILLLCPVAGLAGWGSGCGPVGPSAPGLYPTFVASSPAVQTSAPAWEWRKLDSDPGRLYLFRDGIQVGGLDLTDGYYRPYDAVRGWGPKGQIDLEAIRAKIKAEIRKGEDLEVIPGGLVQQQQFPPGGVETDKISPQERYRCRDSENLSKQQAIQLIRDVPSFHLRRRFTVIGTADQVRQIMADAKGQTALGSWLTEQQCLVQGYDPADWAVRAETGFVHDGNPTIYWQDKPNEKGYGKVLFHGRDYPGPDVLVGALRKADPHYDPKKDPDGKKKPDGPSDPDTPHAIGIDWHCVRCLAFPGCLVAFLIAMLFRRNS